MASIGLGKLVLTLMDHEGDRRRKLVNTGGQRFLLSSAPTQATPHQYRMPDHCMNDSDPTSRPTASRITLKLKGAARKSPDDRKAPPAPPPNSRPSPKPGAQWSDDYKRRMQADMDDLTSKRR
jgi:hypothetical protein